MYISLTNTIGAIRTAVGIVTKNLQLWLNFTKSDVIGSEEMVNGVFNFDDTSSWGGYFDSFTFNVDHYNLQRVNTGGRVKKVLSPALVIGNTYIVEVVAKSPSSDTIKVGVINSVEDQDELTNYITTTNYASYKHTFVATSDTTHAVLWNFSANSNVDYKSYSIKEVSQFVKDKSPNTNNAKLFTGKALSFDGNDYVDCGGSAGLSFAPNKPFTISNWVTFDSVQSKTILSKGTADTSDYEYRMYVESNKLSFRCYSPTASEYIGRTYSVALQEGVTHRVSATYDGGLLNSSIELYVNGLPVSDTDAGGGVFTGMVDNSANLYIGKFGSVYMSGILSDLQIYNKAWTAEDALFDYNNPNLLAIDNPATSLVVTDLEAYWALSEGAGSVAYDSSGGSNSGSIYDNTVIGATYVDKQPTIPQLGMMDWAKGSNLIPYSEDFTEWTTTGSATVTPNTTTSPDGTQNADTLNIVSGDFFFEPITSGAGTFTLSCYVKVASGTLDFKMQSYSSTDGANASSNFTANSNWQRFEFTTTVTVDSNFYPIQVSGLTGGDFQIWGAQLEESSSAGNYILTDGEAAIDVTTVENPSNKGYDILGNPLRLRQNAFNLDGKGYAEIANDTTLDFGTGEFSIESWVKASNIGGINVILSLGANYNNTDSAGLGTHSTSKFLCYVGGSAMYSDSVFIENDWYHLVVTRDSVGLCTLYVDSQAQIDTETNTNSISNSNIKKVGRDDTSNRFYTNLIDEPRLYNRALTQKEITNNYNIGFPTRNLFYSYSNRMALENYTLETNECVKSTINAL